MTAAARSCRVPATLYCCSTARCCCSCSSTSVAAAAAPATRCGFLPKRDVTAGAIVICFYLSGPFLHFTSGYSVSVGCYLFFILPPDYFPYRSEEHTSEL